MPEFVTNMPHLLKVAVLLFSVILFLYGVYLHFVPPKINLKKPPTMKLGDVLKHIHHSQQKSLLQKGDNYDEAFRDIKNHHAEGNISVKGEWAGEKTLKNIDPTEWSNLFIPLDHTVERGTNFAQCKKGKGQYIDLRFYEDEIHAIWPKEKKLLRL